MRADVDKNKVLLLTGATGKLGRLLFAHFLNAGWTVVATSRDRTRLDALLAEHSQQAERAFGVVVDFQLPGAVPGVVRELSKKGLFITRLINNARSLATLAVKPDGTTQRAHFMQEFDLDVVVPYELTMALAQSDEHQLRSVVNIGSQYGLVAPNPALYDDGLNQSPIQYGVSKAGLHHLTRELAVRLAPQGIQVNCVAFGGVEGRNDTSFLRRYAELVPTRRMLNETEVAGPVAFLLDEASSAVNGHVLVADGGWTLW